MTWLILATIGQFLNAFVAILDKYLVSDKNTATPPLRPFVYAFYTCLLTGAWILVYALGFIPVFARYHVPTLGNVEAPTLVVVSMALLAAYTFFMALVSMYDALRQADASDVMPVIGAVAGLASFGMNYYFLGGHLSQTFMVGVIFLSLGTFLVSRTRFNFKIALVALHSGIFFAFHYITMKGLFLETNFDNGFFWSRIAFVGFALSLLMVPAYLEKIKAQTSATSRRSGALIIATKVLAGIAAFMLLKATDLGDVTVVQALDGLKYVFIIVLGFIFMHFIPDVDDEVHDVQTIFRKIIYIALISFGFAILFV